MKNNTAKFKRQTQLSESLQRHFGWARLTVNCSGFVNVDATITGYAYETLPNKAIIAGKTHGKQNATPGRLAQGALGR